MNALSTVVVVHDRAAPEARVLLALCPDDLALLRRDVGWVALDEVIGISSLLPCEACVFLHRELGSVPLPVPAARLRGRGEAAS